MIVGKPRLNVELWEKGGAAGFTAPPPWSKRPCDDLLIEFGRKTKVIRVRKNKDVIVSDYRHESLYVVQTGWLIRYKILHNGCRQIVDFILPGEIFGLQACLFKASLYSVAAITDATLSAIPIAVIDDVFERSPRLSRALFWSAICEAAILGEHLTDAARRSARGDVFSHATDPSAHRRCARIDNGPCEPDRSVAARGPACSDRRQAGVSILDLRHYLSSPISRTPISAKTRVRFEKR